VATDSYGKHRLGLKRIADAAAGLGKFQTQGATPRGPVERLLLHTDPTAATTIVGEPYHNVIRLRALVSPQCNDAVTFLRDHQTLLCRLSAEPAPLQDLSEEQSAEPPELSQAAQDLLKVCVENNAKTFHQQWQQHPQAARELQAFLSSPGVRKATQIWKQVFDAQPPMPVIARCCAKCHAAKPPCVKYTNYVTMADFKAEINKMEKWYTPGRRVDRWRQGLLRTTPSASAFERGRRSVFTAKVRDHYRRLRHQLYMEGLSKWRSCALQLHKAQLSVQSGTIPVERLWSYFVSLWPQQSRNVTETTFEFFSLIGFLRYNYAHYHKHEQSQEPWARRDPLLQQKIADFHNLLRAATSGEMTDLQQAIEEACKAKAPSAKQ